MSFVLDNSAAMGWCMPDERPPELMELLETVKYSRLFAPAIWSLEFPNALQTNYRKRRIDRIGVRAAFSLVQALDIAVVPAASHEVNEAMFDRMLQFDLTSYDLTYLNLPIELNLPLATLDARLASAANASGVNCVL